MVSLSLKEQVSQLQLQTLLNDIRQEVESSNVDDAHLSAHRSQLPVSESDADLAQHFRQHSHAPMTHYVIAEDCERASRAATTEVEIVSNYSMST